MYAKINIFLRKLKLLKESPYLKGAKHILIQFGIFSSKAEEQRNNEKEVNNFVSPLDLVTEQQLSEYSSK